MKALEMLYRDKKWIEEECDISKIPIERVQTMVKDLVEINEAIAELEALQPMSCDGCKYEVKYYECIECSNNFTCSRQIFTDRYEAKEQL